MRTIAVYSKPDCHLCCDAMAVLQRLRPELGFELVERDIREDDTLQRAYFERIPVIVLDDEELFDHFVDEEILRARLRGNGSAGPPR